MGLTECGRGVGLTECETLTMVGCQDVPYLAMLTSLESLELRDNMAVVGTGGGGGM